MAGWRIGFAVGAAELVARIQLLLDHVAAGVWTGLQRGLAAALRSDQADVAERRATYLRRRDALIGALRGAGADIAPPEGSFYAWWKLPEGVTPERLMDEARVGVAPGEGFGSRGAGWARLSLAVPDVDVEEAGARLGVALQR
jgi:aminotransferase